jgi:hypothetical protein
MLILLRNLLTSLSNVQANVLLAYNKNQTLRSNQKRSVGGIALLLSSNGAILKSNLN